MITCLCPWLHPSEIRYTTQTRPTTYHAIVILPTWSSLRLFSTRAGVLQPSRHSHRSPCAFFFSLPRLPTINKTTFACQSLSARLFERRSPPPSVRLGPSAPQVMQDLQGAIIPAVARAAKDMYPPDVQATAKAAISTALSASLIATTTPTPTMTAVTATATGSPHDGPEGSGECRLLGSFAVLVQLALGALALLVLVYKRWRERPQRPVKIWFFDASKQVFGSVLVHGANVFMSMLTSGRLSIKVDPAAAAAARRWLMPRGHGADAEKYVPNPCSFYLLNLAIDVSLLTCSFDFSLLFFSVVQNMLTRDIPRIPDDDRNTHPDPSRATYNYSCFPYAAGQAIRVDTVGLLRQSSQVAMVAQAEHNILLRTVWHEDMCPHNLPSVPLDQPRRRLGTRLD